MKRPCSLINLLYPWTGYLIIMSEISGAVRLNLVTIILGEDVNYGWYATGPMYDVAFQQVDEIYPGLLANSTRHVLYQKNVLDCSDAAANVVAMAGKVFGLVGGSNSTTVLFTPGMLIANTLTYFEVI